MVKISKVIPHGTQYSGKQFSTRECFAMTCMQIVVQIRWCGYIQMVEDKESHSSWNTVIREDIFNKGMSCNDVYANCGADKMVWPLYPSGGR